MSVSDCTSQEKQQVLQYLMPQLMCSYAAAGDTNALQQLGKQVCVCVCMSVYPLRMVSTACTTTYLGRGLQSAGL